MRFDKRPLGAIHRQIDVFSLSYVNIFVWVKGIRESQNISLCYNDPHSRSIFAARSKLAAISTKCSYQLVRRQSMDVSGRTLLFSTNYWFHYLVRFIYNMMIMMTLWTIRNGPAIFASSADICSPNFHYQLLHIAITLDRRACEFNPYLFLLFPSSFRHIVCYFDGLWSSLFFPLLVNIVDIGCCTSC